MVSAANEVWVVQFTLPFRVQIGKLTVRVETGVIPTTGDVGIYDVNGNRLVYTGGFSTLSTGNLSLPVVNAPITLNAGFYYLAQTNTSATPTLDAVIIEVGSWDIFTDGNAKSVTEQHWQRNQYSHYGLFGNAGGTEHAG